MNAALRELVALLSLDHVDGDRFRGASQDLGWGTVFGGQVLGQALAAAARTAPIDRLAHSLHAYFLLPGDVSSPITYEVDRTRDGASFSSRRVVARQGERAIFDSFASFQQEEPGLEHADPMPAVEPPEAYPTEEERLAAVIHTLPKLLRERATAERPFEIRPVVPPAEPIAPPPKPARRSVWIRTRGELPADPRLHQALLAYASDYALLTTALLPHGVTWLTPGMKVASLDHAIWFHAPLRVDEWLLHDMESPVARGGRGLVRGRVFTRAGELVATTTQEGLIRSRSRRA
jgi:acyl-CoA thioesterase-2